MRVLPIQENLQGYYACCGKTICCGCDHQHRIKSRERAAKKGQKTVSRTCAFCREPMPKSNEEANARMSKRAELNDRTAVRWLAQSHGYGESGLPLDHAKCIELMRQSADLGCPSAHYYLGSYHRYGRMGLEQNNGKSLLYFEKAAEGGHVQARHDLGCTVGINGDDIASMRHWRLSASLGSKKSMDSLICCFEDGDLHHGDLAESLRAYYRSITEMKSEDRDQYIAYLKMTGKYNAELYAN